MTRKDRKPRESSIPAADPDWERDFGNAAEAAKQQSLPAPPPGDRISIEILPPADPESGMHECKPTDAFEPVVPPALDLDDPMFPEEERRDSLFDASKIDTLPPLGAARRLETPVPKSRGDAALRELTDRYAAGDYSGALAVAEEVLVSSPDHPQALRYADRCRRVLTDMLLAKLGPLDQRAEAALRQDQLRWLSLDHRAGFLLSLIDGQATLEDVIDASGMPRLAALRILTELVDRDVIVLLPAGLR
jgi:hypothetical protein